MEIVIVAAISSITGIVMAWMLNHNWFIRQDARHKYLIKRYKLKQDYGLLNKQTANKQKTGGLDLVKIAKDIGLESDQIQNILDSLKDQSDEEEEGSILENIPPELIDSFIQGISNKKEGNDEPPSY